MIPPLPDVFLGAPLTHRALHDRAAGRPENSRAAVRASAEAGYGMEIDLQLSSDGEAMVFHDYDLGRLTPESGPVRGRSAGELGAIPLLHAGGEGIPTLAEILDIVDGRVAVLLEIKDQDGAMGPDVGPLEQAVARAVLGYAGPVAVMSFNPHSVARMAEHAPALPRGLTTCPYPAKSWPGLSAQVRDRLRGIPDFDRVSASFISHRAEDLHSPHVARLKDAGVPVLCWTVRSEDQERAARQIADNITFEDYAAAIPLP